MPVACASSSLGDPALTARLLEGIKNQNRPAVAAYLEARGERVDQASLERIKAAVDIAVVQQDPRTNGCPIPQSGRSIGRLGTASTGWEPTVCLAQRKRGKQTY